MRQLLHKYDIYRIQGLLLVFFLYKFVSQIFFSPQLNPFVKNNSFRVREDVNTVLMTNSSVEYILIHIC